MSKSETDLLQAAQQAITDWLVKNKPYLFKLDRLATEMGNGELAVTLRVYNGFVTDVVTTEVKRETYKKTLTNGAESPNN